jgi:hypothetical protein
MKTATAALASIAVLVSMIQPCPAPILPFAVAVGAAGVAGLSAATAADIINENGGIRKRQTSNNCMFDLAQAKAWTQVMGDRDWTMVYDLPPSCIAEVNAWNQSPQIEALNSIYGKVEVKNDTTVGVYKAPALAVDTQEFMGLRMWGAQSVEPIAGSRKARRAASFEKN